MADGISYINLMHYFDSINDSIMEEMKMTKAEILKKEILRQYRSVRQFALEMNIPYSTLVTALETAPSIFTLP